MKAAKREVKIHPRNCMLCGFQEVCSDKEWLDHIKKTHSELYKPKPTKKERGYNA